MLPHLNELVVWILETNPYSFKRGFEKLVCSNLKSDKLPTLKTFRFRATKYFGVGCRWRREIEKATYSCF